VSESKAETLFAHSFKFPDEEFTNTRCEKPTGTLTPHKHWEMVLPDEKGRAHLDTYHDRAAAAVYSRLYSLKTGEVAWFRVTRTTPEPST
jgi:hypothetical protein